MRDGLWERVGLVVVVEVAESVEAAGFGADEGVVVRLTGRRGLRCGVCML